jgi:EF hand
MMVPFVFTAGLTLVSNGVVLAQATPDAPPRAPGQSAYTALDANRDGSISRLEATSNPSLSAQFTLLDQNRDGALEPAEFARFETLGAESTPGTPASPDTGTPPGMSGTLRNPPPNRSTPPPLGTSPPPSGATPTPDGSTPPPTPD